MQTVKLPKNGMHQTVASQIVSIDVHASVTLQNFEGYNPYIHGEARRGKRDNRPRGKRVEDKYQK